MYIYLLPEVPDFEYLRNVKREQHPCARRVVEAVRVAQMRNGQVCNTEMYWNRKAVLARKKEV